MIYKFINDIISYNLRKIKSKKISYSQTGIDLILEKIFNHKNTGLYIDVGCNHPVYNNNTYNFYKKGWNGINIDVDSDSIKLFNYFRNKDLNINSAISSKIAEHKYYFFHSKSPLNTLDKSLANLHSVKPKEVRSINTTTLNNVFENSRFFNSKIDFLCIDVEGHELDVIKGLNLNKYRPNVIVVEYLNKNLKKIEIKNLSLENVLSSELYKYLINYNYELVNWLHSDLIFVDKSFKD